MAIEILAITPNAVAFAWRTALPLLEKPIGMSQGCYLPEDVLEACQTGNMQMWLAADGEDVVAAFCSALIMLHVCRIKIIRTFVQNWRKLASVACR